jgi:hypothetical protein
MQSVWDRMSLQTTCGNCGLVMLYDIMSSHDLWSMMCFVQASKRTTSVWAAFRVFASCFDRFAMWMSRLSTTHFRDRTVGSHKRV